RLQGDWSSDVCSSDLNLLRDHGGERGEEARALPLAHARISPNRVLKRVGEEDGRPNHLVGMHGGGSSALGAGAMGQAFEAISGLLRIFVVCVDAVPLSLFCLSCAAPTVPEGLLDYGMAWCFGGLRRGVRDLSSGIA